MASETSILWEGGCNNQLFTDVGILFISGSFLYVGCCLGAKVGDFLCLGDPLEM